MLLNFRRVNLLTKVLVNLSLHPWVMELDLYPRELLTHNFHVYFMTRCLLELDIRLIHNFVSISDVNQAQFLTIYISPLS